MEEADQGQPPERNKREDDGRPERDRVQEEEGDKEQGQQPGEEQDHHHLHHHHKEGGGGDISCEISMQEWMPGPTSQASQGGTSPETEIVNLESNHGNIMRLETEEKDNKKRTKLRQATLRWPPEGV